MSKGLWLKKGRIVCGDETRKYLPMLCGKVPCALIIDPDPEEHPCSGDCSVDTSCFFLQSFWWAKPGAYNRCSLTTEDGTFDMKLAVPFTGWTFDGGCHTYYNTADNANPWNRAYFYGLNQRGYSAWLSYYAECELGSISNHTHIWRLEIYWAVYDYSGDIDKYNTAELYFNAARRDDAFPSETDGCFDHGRGEDPGWIAGAQFPFAGPEFTSGKGNDESWKLWNGGSVTAEPHIYTDYGATIADFTLDESRKTCKK